MAKSGESQERGAKSQAVSREQKTLLVGIVLAALVFWLYMAYIISPLLREHIKVNERVKLAKERLKMLQVSTANQAALQEQYRQLQQSVAVLRNPLPPEEQLPVIIERLSDLASQAQVKIQTIFPQRSIEEDLEKRSGDKSSTSSMTAPVLPEAQLFTGIIIQIDALAGFHQLGTFLGSVEALGKPMQLASLRIANDPKDPKRHRVKLLIRAFFSVNLPELSDVVQEAGSR